MTPADYRKKLARPLQHLREARSTVRGERASLASAQERETALREAQAIAQTVAAACQTTAHRKIADIVTKCLALFEEPYTFHIKFERKRGKTEARLVFERDGNELEDPTEEAGLGCVDVAAFALRVAALVLSQPPRRRLLVLDEPFRFVSEGYRPRVRVLLESLSKDLGIQFILVTHDRALVTGKVVELE